MNEKFKIIYILVILWIVIGTLFIGMFVQRILEILHYLNSGFTFETVYSSVMVFSYAITIILYIIIIALSFLLAYGTLIKKTQSWLIGIILSSFLIYFVFQAINFIGSALIVGNIDTMFSNIGIVANLLLLFFVPCLMFILTRPEVKSYFGKT